MKTFFIYCFLLVLLPACSFKSEPVISNQYVSRAKDLTAFGLDALHQGRLVSAQHSMELALNSAWLSADFVWVGLAQYQLGAVYMTQGKTDEAVELFQEAQKHALESKDRRTGWRCTFALALYQQQIGQAVQSNTLPQMHKDMPADVHISAGRLAQLQHRNTEAQAAYQHVLTLPAAGAGRMYEHSQANLGLALLAKDQGNKALALDYSGKVIALSKQAGFPMLAAHAYLLQGKVASDVNKLDKALHIYQALNDRRGQYDSLDELAALAKERGDKADLKRWLGLKQSLDKNM
ncbi:MAG: hypothetical protein R8M14_09875 [Ghiorsea sp.]